MENFKNKTVLITGAGGGIGLYLSSYFAEAGAQLILADISVKSLINAQNRLKKYNVPISVYAVDQTKKDEVDKIAADIIRKSGAPDILINNAGIGFQGALDQIDIKTFENLMNTNFWGTLYFVYAFLPAMKTRKSGHIVNVATGQVYFQLPTWGAYTVSKTALATFTDILRAEINPYHIDVTTVYPYMVNTAFYQDVKSETLASKLSMVLLPLYSQSPQTVAKTIFRAVAHKKKVEMMHPINYLFKYLRFFTPPNNLIDRLTARSLIKPDKKPSSQKNEIERQSFLSKNVFQTIPAFGFRIDEVMSGEHEFEERFGPVGKHPMEFKVRWGTDNFKEWIDPKGEKFLMNHLHGTVKIEELCDETPCTGQLQLRYFKGRKILYSFTFTVDGTEYEYVGIKRNILPWNLLYTHTTCFGKLYLKENHTLISRSVTHFHLDTMRDFVQSMRFV